MPAYRIDSPSPSSLTARALDDCTAAGMMDPASAALLMRSLALIDTLAAGSDNDKDCIKALIILAHADPIVFDDMGDIADRYGRRFATMVEDMLNGCMTNATLQAAAATNIATMEWGLAQAAGVQQAALDAMQAWQDTFETAARLTLAAPALMMMGQSCAAAMFARAASPAAAAPATAARQPKPRFN